MSPSEIDAWATAYIQAELDPDLLKHAAKHPLWWAIDKSMFCAGETPPEELWPFILAVTSKEPPIEVLAVLAAGPLEQLIAYAGDGYIDRIELEARRNPAFRHLLGGVWRHGTEDSIWQRVEAARGEPW